MSVFQNGLRWQLALVLLVTFFVAYLDRLNITFALPLMAQEYHWSDLDTRNYGSLLMGLFYAGYGLASIVLTPFAVTLGPRRSLLLIVCLWSLFTALGAWVSQWLLVLMATRVLLGLSEGVHVPMMSQLVKHWFPLQERARANSVFVSGLFFAVLLAPFLLVPLMGHFGWRAGFLVLASVGLLVSLPLVLVFVRDTPQSHPQLGATERELIERSRKLEDDDEYAGLGWTELFTMPRFLLLLAIGILNNIIALGFTSWLPTYFTQTRGIPFNEITLLVAMPYAFSLLGLALWATLGDRFNIRAGLAALGFAGAGVMIAVALGSGDMTVVIACFSLGVFLISAFNACEFAMVQRVSPADKVAPAVGAYNGLAMIVGGGLGPIAVSPMVVSGGATWVISALALGNALLLLLAWRVIRY